MLFLPPKAVIIAKTGNAKAGTIMKRFLALWALMLTLGCQQPGGGGSPFEMHPPIPQKKLVTNSANVEMICCVDVEKYNPLNAKDYFFSASAESSETQFFNYVVLAYAYLTRDGQGYIHVELSPALKHVLDNGLRYIKPLHLKGIKVLVEIRSGLFSDTEDGMGLGFGTMDMAAINEFTRDLKTLVDHYGIDGFDFNDIGGGRNAYPPLTRNLTQFQSSRPLYPEEMFIDKNGIPLSDSEIELLLWREGGNNFSNLIQRTNEHLKEIWNMELKNGEQAVSVTQSLERPLLVRAVNHGGRLLSKIRDEYMPDAYAGADAKVEGNLHYIVHDSPYDSSKPHASLWDEVQKADVGAASDDQYAPFGIDLSDKKDAAAARHWARTFLLKNPDGTTDSPNQNRYGALYFFNLPPISESDNTAYLTYFSTILFGRTTRLAGSPGAGDYKKDW